MLAALAASSKYPTSVAALSPVSILISAARKLADCLQVLVASGVPSVATSRHGTCSRCASKLSVTSTYAGNAQSPSSMRLPLLEV